MKNCILYRLLPLFLLAFLNANSISAFPHQPIVLDLNSRNYDYLQEDQNTSALLFEEISISTASQVVFKNTPLTGDFQSCKSLFALGRESSGLLTSNIYLQDKRSLLQHQIFPFHFFL